jgi:hypothetical protein
MTAIVWTDRACSRRTRPFVRIPLTRHWRQFEVTVSAIRDTDRSKPQGLMAISPDWQNDIARAQEVKDTLLLGQARKEDKLESEISQRLHNSFR